MRRVKNKSFAEGYFCLGNIFLLTHKATECVDYIGGVTAEVSLISYLKVDLVAWATLAVSTWGRNLPRVLRHCRHPRVRSSASFFL